MPLQNFQVNCTILDRRTIPTPTGGVSTIFTDGAKFRAAVHTATSDEAVTAMQTTGKEIYTIMVEKNIPLKRDSYFRNERTGEYIRIINMGIEIPEISSLSVKEFKGEFIGMSIDNLPK